MRVRMEGVDIYNQSPPASCESRRSITTGDWEGGISSRSSILGRQNSSFDKSLGSLRWRMYDQDNGCTGPARGDRVSMLGLNSIIHKSGRPDARVVYAR